MTLTKTPVFGKDGVACSIHAGGTTNPMKSMRVAAASVAIRCERLRNIAPEWGKQWGKFATVCSLLLALPAGAAEGWRAIDGDTVVTPWSEVVRVENIDAPELRCRCARECDLAERARRYTQAALASAADVRTVITGSRPRDRHGRTLARVVLDGRDLGEMLIRAGLARPWEGRRRAWC